MKQLFIGESIINFTHKWISINSGILYYFGYILIILNSSKGALVIHENEFNIDIRLSISKIIDDYSIYRTTVFIAEEETNSVLWTETVKSMTQPFIVISQHFIEKIETKFLLIMFPKFDTNYTDIISRYQRDTFFVLIFSESIHSNKILTYFLSQFVKTKKIFNILLVPDKEGKISVYTSLPFSSYYCKNAATKVQIDSFNNGSFIQQKHLFDVGKFMNLHGCPLTAIITKQVSDSILPRSGKWQQNIRRFVTETIQILCKKLNFEPNMIYPMSDQSFFKHGNKTFYNDNSYGEVIRSIKEGKVDFAIGMFSGLSFTKYNDITFGVVTHSECYNWVIPILPDTQLFLSKYFREFPLEFWTIFICFVFFSVCFVVFICRVLGKSKSMYSLMNILQFTVATLVNQPIADKINVWSARIFIAHWLIIMLIITNAYLALLWSFMLIPTPTKKFHTLEQLISSPIEIGGTKNIFDIIKDIQSDDTYTQKAIHSYRIISSSDSKNITPGSNLAVIGEVSQLMSSSEEENGIYSIDGCWLRVIGTQFMFHEQSALATPINRVVRRLFETGIIQELSGVGRPFPNSKQNYKYTSNKSKGLTFYQVKGVYYIFLGGLLGSFLVFIGEITVAKISKKSSYKGIMGQKLYYHRFLP